MPEGTLTPSNVTATPPPLNGSWLTRQNVLAMLLIVCTLLSFFLVFLMLRPFLAPLAWALALAIVAHPLHSFIKKRIGNEHIAALLSVFVVMLILVAPTIYVGHQLLQEVANNIDWIQSPDEQTKWRAALEKSPIGDWYVWLEQRFDLTGQVRAFFDNFASSVTDVVKQSIWTIVQLLVMLFTLYFLFRDRRDAVATLRSLVPLSAAETDEVLKLVQDTIHATIYGSVLMAVLQGVLGGLMFWFLGLPSPIFWGFVMAVLATVPNLGAFLIWAPAAVGLALHDQWGKATILVLWGLTAVSLIDNLLYPYVVGSRIRMHTLPVFFAILGGIMVFGPAGLILGPIVFALTHALIDIWRRRTRDGRSAETGSSPLVVEPAQIQREAPPVLTATTPTVVTQEVIR